MKNLNQQFTDFSAVFYKAQKDAHSKFEQLLTSLGINKLEIDATYEFDKRDVWCNLIIKNINDISLNLNSYEIDDEINIENTVKIFKKLSQGQKINLIKLDDEIDGLMASVLAIAELSFNLKKSPIEIIGFLSNLVNSNISLIPSKYVTHTS